MHNAHGSGPKIGFGNDEVARRAVSLELRVLCVALLFLSACAGRRVTFPTDPGAPLADFAAIHAQVSGACRGVSTFSSELSIAGRAGSERLRGRIVSGFARPASMRLEGVAPFGPPAFILVTRGEAATLVLPRDNAVLRGARAEDILGALTGVALPPPALQALLTGCVEPNPQPTGGKVHQNGWASIDLQGGAVLYLQRRDNAWQVRGGRRDGWEIEYLVWQGQFPQQLRLRATSATPSVDLNATIGQLEANVDLADAAFEVVVPDSATPISLEALRENGPLAESKK